MDGGTGGCFAKRKYEARVGLTMESVEQSCLIVPLMSASSSLAMALLAAAESKVLAVEVFD